MADTTSYSRNNIHGTGEWIARRHTNYHTRQFASLSLGDTLRQSLVTRAPHLRLVTRRLPRNFVASVTVDGI